MKYDILIGLEFHVQLKTKSKMFCRCLNSSDNDAPNINLCPICLGQPGTLPMVNEQAIKMGIKAALAINCAINKFTKFDRKNYFYPDLPKGYQISQFDKPLAENGYFDINNVAADGLAGRLDVEEQLKRIPITRLHLEEDTAKSIHQKDATLIDFNRAGAPLIEIVTGPYLSSPQEAKTFGQELQLLLRALEISEADLEKGHLRCDANISLKPEGETQLYPKTEIKNLNSFKALERALEFEIKRQKALWEDGKAPQVQETRGWNDKKQETFVQRTKEGSADYRYFPEPDIPPLTITDEEINQIKSLMPELPQEKRYRFMDMYGFTPEETKILTEDKDLANYSEQVISELKDWLGSLPENVEADEVELWQKNKTKLVKLVANWLINNLLTLLTDKAISFNEQKITAENFAEFITLIYQNKVNSTSAQKILEIMIENGADPSRVMDDYKLGQVSDEGAINEIIKQVIDKFPNQVAEFKAGKEPIIKFLLGQVMKDSKGSAEPKTAEKLLREKLK